MKLNKNMGSIDKVVRILAAIIFVYLYFSGTVTGVLGIILLAFAVIFILTSLISFCPLYLPFKFSTVKKKD